MASTTCLQCLRPRPRRHIFKCFQETLFSTQKTLFSHRGLSSLCCHSDHHLTRDMTSLGLTFLGRCPPVCVLQSRFNGQASQHLQFRSDLRKNHLSLWNLSRFMSNRHFATSSTYASNDLSKDTIFALSSGQGKCGIAVIRVSGPSASEAFLAMTKMFNLPEAKKVHLTRLYNPVNEETVDKGLVVWFPAPQSFTGEDVVEFHVHGGPAVISVMYSALDALGFRHAEPGEFTKRAFMNGKLDLTEVEGLGDLIHAETEAQRRQALRQMEGDLGKLYEEWRRRLIKCVAHVEAYIDFSEDENIEEGILDEAQAGASELLKDICAHLDDNRCGERLRSGVQVAIIGQPNVGKSSLLNLLCQRPAAIVTPIAGTTRDVIESAVNIGGYPVLLIDTAGIQETQDVVELEGVRRARQRAEDADITIVMTEANDIISIIPTSSPVDSSHGNILAILERKLQETAELIFDPTKGPSSEDAISEVGEFQKDTIVVINKSDLLDNSFKDASLDPVTGKYCEEKNRELQRAICVISCKTGEGMDNFLDTLRGKVKALCGNPLVGNPGPTQARHRSNLKRCIAALNAFPHQQDLVMAAEQLKIALKHLGKITGRVGAEEILDMVFKDFCIGK